MLFQSCCCGPAVDDDHISLEVSLDERVEGTQAVKVFEATPSQPADPSAPTLLQRVHSGRGAPTGEVVSQVPRLQLPSAQVSFAVTVAKGRPCIVLSEATGLRTAATYRVDVQKGLFVLDCGSSQAVCPVANIEDIYQIADGEECFTPEVLRAVKVAERGSLFLIVYSLKPDAEPVSLCLLEQSQQARDDLLDTLKNMSIA